MAEQAGVIAAGLGSFGGGSVAAQLAEQEINLAAQKGGQMIAAAASAPMETLGLTGGQMGAPSVNPMGGWVGKVVSGLIGQGTQIPNMAGASQKPAQPKDGKDQQQQDPAGGNGGKQAASPSGSKDDPMHVKNVGGGNGGGQHLGDITSASGVAAMQSGILV
jgi:hypothetical protein